MITQRHFAGMFLFNWEIPNHYSPVGTGSNRFMIVYRGRLVSMLRQAGRSYRAVRQRNTHHSTRCVMTSWGVPAPLYMQMSLTVACKVHTTVEIPLLVRSAKSSTVGQCCIYVVVCLLLSDFLGQICARSSHHENKSVITHSFSITKELDFSQLQIL